MWSKKTSLLLILPLASLLLSPGCATVIQKRTQRIPVTSTPVGATVSVNGTEQGTTPLEVRLSRKLRDQSILIESPGYNPVNIQVRRKRASGYIVGNVALGALVGGALAWGNAFSNDDKTPQGYFAIYGPICIAVPILIDLAAGKGYKLTPKDLTVTLTKADGTPRVDKLFVDAEELQNIKWIRIRDK